jgi:hypothetical protein
MKNNIIVSYEARPAITIYVWIMGILAGLASLFLLIGGKSMNSAFNVKIVMMAFILALLSVSAITCSKHLKKGGPTYGLGMVGLVTCIVAFSIMTLMLLFELSNRGLMQLGGAALYSSAGFGYICGIMTIPENNSPLVKMLKIIAVAAVSGIILFLVYVIFTTNRYEFDFLSPSSITDIGHYGVLIQIALFVAFSFTLMAKLQSMIAYEPPQEILFDYEKDALQNAAQKQD